MGDNKRGQRATTEQLECILDAVEKNPSLQLLRQSFGVEPANAQQWDELVEKLNSIGPVKTVAKWQKAWRDYRLKTKKKATKILEEQTDDKSATFQGLSDLEVRTLNLEETYSTHKIIKPPEINIGNIAELDPLSSDESSDGPIVLAPNLVTVYELKDDQVKTESNQDYTSNKKTDKDKIRKRRIEFRPYFNSDQLSKDTSEILQRLASMEESNRRSDETTHSLLKRLCVAMETNAQATNNLAVAVEKQINTLTDSINAWLKNNSR